MRIILSLMRNNRGRVIRLELFPRATNHRVRETYCGFSSTLEMLLRSSSSKFTALTKQGKESVSDTSFREENSSFATILWRLRGVSSRKAFEKGQSHLSPLMRQGDVAG
ncbi:hypothetical protein NPIL_45561 [Nephila pilipes]|uniref:Uncharacterized protein n=1 Tax=Nephila pilipes TaxID=299642 RepID=A0A8X6P079_NEPPI|nr:hypothetical protein NPIL_45561 [Nephila pilipes]